MLITFGLFHHPGNQIQLMMIMTELYIIYIGHVEFYMSIGSKILEIFNESVFVLIQYGFLLLHNIVWDEKVREQIGNIVVGLTILLIACNMTVIIFASIRPLCRKCYLRNLRKKTLRKHQEEMKLLQDKKD